MLPVWGKEQSASGPNILMSAFSGFAILVMEPEVYDAEIKSL
jgi:hypothetical protein